MYLLALIAALGAPADNRDGKTMAADDWHSMAIYGVGNGGGGGGGSGPIYLQVHAGDLDGDGVPDDAVVRLICGGGQLQAAHYNVKSPRDSASGMASGKRTHHPVTFVKEWGPSTPQLRAMKPTYDVKAAKGARMTADGGGWTALRLANADGLCAAAASATINTSRSNVKSN